MKQFNSFEVYPVENKSTIKIEKRVKEIFPRSTTRKNMLISEIAGMEYLPLSFSQ